jgi:hypothetical protein
MEDETAISGFWSSVRDLNAGYLIIAAGLAALLVAIYLLRSRPVSLGDILPSLDQIETIAAFTAFALIIIAALAVLWELIWQAVQEEESTIGSVISSIKDLHAAYVIFAVSFAVFIAGVIFLRKRDDSIADLWQAPSISIDTLRSYALATAVVLVATVIVASLARFFWSGIFAREFTSIAPFTISGSDDKQRGLALATAFQAKLAEIERDKQVLTDVLHKEAADDDPESETPVPRQQESESTGLDVYRKIEFEFKFQGMDVGGIVNWVINSLTMNRAMQITVAEQGTNAVVSGALRADGSSHVYATVESKNERIVAAVAYSKLREALIAQQSEFHGLEWSDIELLHHIIMSVGNLRGRSQVNRKDFEPHHDAIAALIAKVPSLESLLTLGAEIAMKAGKIDHALAYHDRTREFLDRKRVELDQERPDPTSKSDPAAEKDNASKFKDLRREFVRKYNEQVVQRQRIISSCALEFVERLHSRESPETVFKDALALHKELLKVNSVEKKRDVTIAIIGGIPQRDFIGYQFASKGTWVPGKYGLDNFADTIGLVVSTLAPGAKLTFIPLGENSHSAGLSLTANESEIAEAMDIAVQDKPDVALIPFSPLSRSSWKKRAETLQKHGRNMIIVSPVAPKATQEYLAKIQLGVSSLPAAFIGTVDIDGRFKASLLSYSEEPARYPGALWAPGTRIPRLTTDGMWQTTYGREYAAAAAAAVFANIAAAADIKDPHEIISTVRRTLRFLDGRDREIGIIDQTAALGTAAAPADQGNPPPNVCGKTS